MRGESNAVSAITLDGDGTEPESYPSSTSDDFRLEADGPRLYLQPRHGAQFAQSTITSGFGGCASARYTKGRVRLDGLAKGVDICVRTDAGRYAELTLDAAVTKKTDPVLFAFKVWDR